MSSSYPGNIPKWLDDNKTFATQVFPSLPQPWHMDQRRVLAKESGKTTLVRKSLPPKSLALCESTQSSDPLNNPTQ